MGDNRVQRISQALVEAASQDPQLSTYYEFQRMLLHALSQTRADISATLQMVDEEALMVRVDRGLPLVSFDQLPLEGRRFAELVSTVAQLLVDYDPDLAQQKVPEDAAECLAIAERRFEENQARERTLQETAEPLLKQVAVDLALKPYLEWAAEEVLPHLEQERWKRGYCPVCGGAPDFAALEAETGSRRLLCSRCSSEWPYPRMRCPFCGTADHTKLSYYPGENGVYRLYVCGECSRYLKTVDLREVGREVLLPAERITTIAMDAAARKAGYT